MPGEWFVGLGLQSGRCCAEASFRGEVLYCSLPSIGRLETNEMKEPQQQPQEIDRTTCCLAPRRCTQALTQNMVARSATAVICDGFWM